LIAADSSFARRVRADDPAWLHFFAAAELAAEFAHSYRDLGMAGKAIEHGPIAVEDADPLYARCIACCRVVLAAGTLGTGNVEHGLALAEPGVAAAAGFRSVRARAYVRDFARRLAPLSGHPAVADFLSRVGAVLAA
jgi:hypothetical protein